MNIDPEAEAHPSEDRHPPWRHGPPWGHRSGPDWSRQWGRHRMHDNWSPDWHRKRRGLFLRFLGVIALMAALITGGMAALAFLFTGLFGGDGQTAVLVWVGGCGLALALPMAAMLIARSLYRRVGTPLVNVMAAADTVAAGDLSVRVPEQGSGDFSRLARSFNRMTEELARSDQQRRNLTADVAHELRTPLHIIQGNLEGILDGVYEPSEAHLAATLDETRLLARLVEDLRTLSLAEAGELPLIFESADISDVLADIKTSFSGQAEAAEVELQVSVTQPNQIKPLRVDLMRLDQILSNLVANALRHTGAGGTIDLRAEPLRDGVKIRVRDTGQGIPPEDLPFIFDRFWRGDRARTHSGGAGGGLGLAITRQLVQAHGGTISVESEPGLGTTFTIELTENR